MSAASQAQALLQQRRALVTQASLQRLELAQRVHTAEGAIRRQWDSPWARLGQVAGTAWLVWRGWRSLRAVFRSA